MWFVTTDGRLFQSPIPRSTNVKYDHHVQVRVNQSRKKIWQDAARIRRRTVSDFIRDCADAGAATRLHQKDLIKNFRQLRRFLNAASAANQNANRVQTEAQIASALTLIRKLQGGDL